MGCNNSQPNTLPLPKQVPECRVIKRKNSQFVHARKVNSISNFFEITRTLGCAEVGTLFQAIEKRSRLPRIIRELSKSQEEYQINVFQEVMILNKLDHPNILKVFDVLETPKRFYLELESVQGNTLKSLIGKPWDEDLASKILREIFSAVHYMHLQGVVHCDLNSDHIVVYENQGNYDVKIIGFSFSQFIVDMQEIDIQSISYHYASPEMLGGAFDNKTDIWSIGINLYALLVGKLPFATKEKCDIIAAIYHGDLDFSHPNFIALSNNVQDLIRNLLVLDIGSRYSALDALNHKWLKQTVRCSGLTHDTLDKLSSFKVKTNIVKEILHLINYRLAFPENEVVRYFKQIDENFDGKISRQEIIDAFDQVGIDVQKDIDPIMDNLDNDGNGYLEYTELKIVLTEWEKIISKKTLIKVFSGRSQSLSFSSLKSDLANVPESEWEDFVTQVPVANDEIDIETFKNYIISQIE